METSNNHEQKFVDKVITLLETRSEDFSGKWFTGKTLDSSVQYKDKMLLVGDNGDIIQPIKPQITIAQKIYIKKLVKSIMERDSIEILKQYDI